MRFGRVILHRLRSLFRRSHAEADLQREIELHFEQLVKEAIASGMSEAEARAIARRQFGPLEKAKEECRDTRRIGLIENFLRDLRYALRMLIKNRGFTAVAVITLALGVGGSTAVFSVVYAVILRPLPYPHPDRLIELFERDPANRGFRVSSLNYLAWAERNHSFEALAAFNDINVNLSDHGEPVRLRGCAITASMFRVLGLQPIAGRPLRADDERPGSNRVALLAEPLWRGRFGGDPSIIGKTITLNGEHYEVIGVVPRAFHEVGRAQVSSTGEPQVFVPLTIDPSHQNRGNHVLRVVGRLRPGISIKRAADEMQAIAAGLGEEFPASNRGWGVGLKAVQESMFDTGARPSLYALLGAAGAVLLIVCANVANLLLVRGVGRRRELALRSAFGAGPAHVVRQLLTENLCLAAVGGACGLLVAMLGMDALRALLPATLPRINEIQLDAPVLSFALLVSIISGLLFGLVPAFRATRVDLLSALAETGKGGFSSRRAVLRRGLVVAQVGLATILLVIAALLIQSFLRLQHVPLGFEPDGVMTARIDLTKAKYPAGEQIAAFYDRLVRSLQGTPQVRAVGIGTSAPFAPGIRATAHIQARSSTAFAATQPNAVEHIVSPGYFRALGTPLLAGRSFGEQDRKGAPPVAIVSAGMARLLWPDTSPIGQILEMNGRRHTVVGVVGNVRGEAGQGARGGGLKLDPRAAVYLAASQQPQRTMTLLVRVDGEPSMIVSAIRQAVREIDPAQPIYGTRSLREWLDESAARPRLTTMLGAAFAGTALLLAAVGIYGVLAYSMQQRTHEIGVRMAVGATRGQVMKLVLRAGMTWACAGIVLGLVGAFALSRILANLLFGVSAHDPLTFAVGGATVAIAALAACCMPAFRATRISPTLALRCE
jgi:predicted permease